MPRIKYRLDRTIDHLRRYEHILTVLAKYGFREVAEVLRVKMGMHIRPQRVGPADITQTRPRRVRLAFQELGPTFVKFGQLLSTRPDLVPPDYVQEFQQLQDRVAPVSFKSIRTELQAQLGRTIEDCFAEFDSRAIAAGSVAQVHKAITLEGDIVAVKIRRPKIKDTLRTECEILTDIATLIKATLSEEETVDPVYMAGEFTRAVMKEVDLSNELRNLQLFQRNFADDPTVHIPKAYPDYCCEGVLTMEFIDGIKPRKPADITSAGLDCELIAQRGSVFVLRQIFDFGVFHTDPHPGNLFILPGNVIVPIDFGQVAHLGAAERALLGEMINSIIEQDAARLIQAFQSQEMLPEGINLLRLSGEIEAILETYRILPLSEIPFGRIMAETFEVIRQYRIRPPGEFTLMLKSMMTIESLAGSLDGEFKLIEALKPFAKRLSSEQLEPARLMRYARRALRDATELTARLPGDINIILSKLRGGQFQLHVQHEHLEDMVRTITKSSNRISFSLIIAGLLVGSSMLVTQEGMVLGLLQYQSLGIAGYLTASILGLWLLFSIIRGR